MASGREGTGGTPLVVPAAVDATLRWSVPRALARVTGRALLSMFGLVLTCPRESRSVHTPLTVEQRNGHLNCRDDCTQDRLSAEAEATGHDHRLPGLERRWPGRDARRGLPGATLGRHALRRDRSGRVLRLSGHAAAGFAHRRRDARAHVARERLFPRAARWAKPRRRPADRGRAESALALQIGRAHV